MGFGISGACILLWPGQQGWITLFAIWGVLMTVFLWTQFLTVVRTCALYNNTTNDNATNNNATNNNATNNNATNDNKSNNTNSFNNDSENECENGYEKSSNGSNNNTIHRLSVVSTCSAISAASRSAANNNKG